MSSSAVHMWAGAPYSWTINPVTPPYYEAVAIQHGYLRVEANRTALTMQACSPLPSCRGVKQPGPATVLGSLLACMLAGRSPGTTLCEVNHHP